MERTYGPGFHHGAMRLSDCEEGIDAGLDLLRNREPDRDGLRFEPANRDGAGRLVFLDIETTGLSGGAGTCAFLVGLAWFEEGSFRIRQLFLPGFTAERALLGHLAAAVRPGATLVTYNGKTFDVPVLETRFLFHRLPAVLSDVPHIDMLPPARRLWRGRARALALDDPASCRLVMLERALFDVARYGDVSGFEIPLRYFQYVRSGRLAPMVPVIEHNRLDLLSLAGVAARTCRLLDSGPEASHDGAECLGLGRLYETRGMVERATRCYERAAALAADAPADEDRVFTEALRRVAVARRRERRHADAAGLWERLLERDPGGRVEPEAAVALAVHHEHRTRDLERARGFAARAYELQRSARGREAVARRLERLARKSGFRGRSGDLAMGE
jgi:uncharacterized protein YprB with RNaseH-like and TPR domain